MNPIWNTVLHRVGWSDHADQNAIGQTIGLVGWASRQGTSTIGLNVAAASARQHVSAVFIDCSDLVHSDLTEKNGERNWSKHQSSGDQQEGGTEIGQETPLGLADVLVGECELEGVTHSTQVDLLSWIPNGRSVLSHERHWQQMRPCLQTIALDHDWIVCDLSTLSKRSGGENFTSGQVHALQSMDRVYLVVSSSELCRSDVDSVCGDFGELGVPLKGVILNRHVPRVSGIQTSGRRC